MIADLLIIGLVIRVILGAVTLSCSLSTIAKSFSYPRSSPPRRAVAVLHRVIYVPTCDDQGLRFRRPGTRGVPYGKGSGYATARGHYRR